MTLFLIVSAFMTAVAVAAVSLPLLRDGKTKWPGLLTAALIAFSAVGLYRHLSSWSWEQASTTIARQADAGGELDVATMVATLEQRLKDQPNNIEGWLMLGRSRLVLGDVDTSVKAFTRAHQLGSGNNVPAALGLGEALSLRAGGRIEGEADHLFEGAIALAPRDPQALLLSGLAAAQRGDTALARTRWESLKAQHPSPQVTAVLNARLAALDEGADAGFGQPGATTAQATVRLVLSPRLAARVSAETPMFVYAQLPGQSGPPLAARRLTTAAIGSSVALSAGDSVVPGNVLSNGLQVTITARIAFSGQAKAAKGDLYGRLLYHIGKDGARELLIDKIL